MSNEKLNFSFRAPEDLVLRKSYDGTPQKNENQTYRSQFMRDRDRIMYCRSFRRLGGKTQIYRAGENDHQRNRLTHTLEVAQLSRTIASGLNLDSDLAEAIALGHDLGHAPFGHAGEEVLNLIMTPGQNNPIEASPLKYHKEGEEHQLAALGDVFGFKHNIQSVRIIRAIDNSYGENGLDLTNFTLWGIMHHSELAYENDSQNCSYRNKLMDVMMHQGRENDGAWSFEAFVVKQADEIAQWHHDLEDALRGKAMTPKDVCNTVEEALAKRLEKNSDDQKLLEKLKEREHIDQAYLTGISHIVIGTLVDWLVESSRKNLEALWKERSARNESLKDFFTKRYSESVEWAISFDVSSNIGESEKDNASGKALEQIFRDRIHEKIHHSQDVERMNAKGKFVIERLFESYYKAPQQLPTSILIQYLLDLKNEDKIPDELKKKEITKAVRAKEKMTGDGKKTEHGEDIVDITTEYIVSSWDTALDVGSGAVRICFKKIWAEAEEPQKILLMRKICDHIAGMTDHFALEEYKNLYA